MKKIFPLLMVAILIALNSYSQEKKELDSITVNKDSSAIKDTSKKAAKIEVQASFPGGQVAWERYLFRNLRNEVAENNNAPNGTYTVQISFIINVDGTVSDVTAKNDPGYGVGKEAIRVIKNSPKWIPGSQNGKTVKSWRTQNISIRVENIK